MIGYVKKKKMSKISNGVEWKGSGFVRKKSGLGEKTKKIFVSKKSPKKVH